MADEEEPGATAIQPEKEPLQEEIQEEIDDIIQQQSDIRENIPSKVLKKSTIDKNGGFDGWK